MKPHHGDPNQALVWGGCGRQRSLARYKANPTSFLYQANFPGLGRGLRGASGTPAKYAGYQADFLGLGRGLRSLKQVLDWLRAVCAASNKYSIGFAQCAQPQTSTRLAPRSVRGLKQALDWLQRKCFGSNKRSIGHHSQR